MANIKDLKKKIKSTKSTFKITSAMKLVSAAKLAKAQSTINALKPYSNELLQTVGEVSAIAKDYTHDYFQTHTESSNEILLVISSDKGLCGGYNANLIKKVRKYLDEAESENREVKVFYIGKKAKEVLGSAVNEGKTYTFEKTDPSYDEIKEISAELAETFTTGEIGKVSIAYNSFISAMSFDSTVRTVLPMSLEEQKQTELKEEFPFDFKYEPNPEEILDTLVPEVFVNTVHTFLLDGIASEHGSRMVAMENARKNCQDVIRKLTLKANKLRQAAITTELIEVVSGAESLKG